jgi:hypothetical protein
MDKRPERIVTKFVDGFGMLGSKYIPRDIDYCSNCKKTKVPFAELVSNLTSNIDERKIKFFQKEIKATEKLVNRYDMVHKKKYNR